MPEALPVVCMAVGEPHVETDLWVRRLHGMLLRHCDRPFRLHCCTDRPRPLADGIGQIDCSGWRHLERPGMRQTTWKLGLFNPAYLPFDEFLYLDLSLVIRRSMAELLAFVGARKEGLVIVPNWHYDGYNSSVMWIRRGALEAVHGAFVAGEVYAQNIPGDQDFIHGAVRRHGLADRVATFPDSMVVSFKKARELGKREPERVRRRMAAATIVKFHGVPKMDTAFSWRYRLDARLRELRRFQWLPTIPFRELRQEWIGGSAEEPGT